MKQSTKLLSLILALLMAFSCMSVIGSATLVKSEVAYDTIDDADLSYEQVSDIALDFTGDYLLKLYNYICKVVLLYILQHTVKLLKYRIILVLPKVLNIIST